ncbi:MAG: DUF427 domain-containing protein [Anaerolineales bacterium]
MPKAIWNGAGLADSDQTVMVEGNHYFPPETVNRDFFTASESHTVCPWKGVASYYNVKVGGKVNFDAAWYYPKPSEPAKIVKNYVAFWRGVEVIP